MRTFLCLLIAGGFLFSSCNKKEDPATENSLQLGAVYDNVGNSYRTVIIGDQVWFTENLKTNLYGDGTPIPLVMDNSVWKSRPTSGYCWNDNRATTYCALYNWHAVNSKKLCPTGWHVPSDADWTKLTNYLGGKSYAGGLLKGTSIGQWANPNTGANNATGFSAAAVGIRNADGTFDDSKNNGYWWSSTENTSGNAFYFGLSYNSSYVDRSVANKQNGYSVRCLQD